jgi:hypothetical protein
MASADLGRTAALTPGAREATSAAGAAGCGRAGPWIEPGDLKRAFKRYQGDEMSDRAAG